MKRLTEPQIKTTTKFLRKNKVIQQEYKNQSLESKKDLGAFYTPNHTANYMVGLLGNLNEKSKILEP